MPDDEPIIVWTAEDYERAFVMMQVLVKNMEFMANMMTAVRTGDHQKIDGIVSNFVAFISKTFKGTNGMKDELVAFARQLGVGMEVHLVHAPPKGPLN